MPRIVSVTWSCDTCGKELDEAEAFLARLPLERGDPRSLRLREGALAPAAGEFVYCSWACLRADVNERAAAAA